MLTFERVVKKAAVDDGNQCVALNVTRKGEFPVRLFDVPFFLKLGSSLSVICEERLDLLWRCDRAEVLHTAFKKKSAGEAECMVSAKSSEIKNRGRVETGAAVGSQGRGLR